ncbi:hypothetical protein KQR54_18860 [Mycobacterium gordonae]|nr:hypothetical protein [Mycobacterium gordonae]
MKRDIVLIQAALYSRAYELTAENQVYLIYLRLADMIDNMGDYDLDPLDMSRICLCLCAFAQTAREVGLIDRANEAKSLADHLRSLWYEYCPPPGQQPEPAAAWPIVHNPMLLDPVQWI